MHIPRVKRATQSVHTAIAITWCYDSVINKRHTRL